MRVLKVTIAILLFFTTGVVAKEKKYSSHIDIGYKIGSDRNLSKVEFFSPIIQFDKSLWFIDLRGWVDDNDTSENNLGLGYRKMIGNSAIIGLYGFYDIRETDLNNEFKQKTYGIELLTKSFDFRANYYDADEKQEFTNTQLINSNPIIVGTQILVSNSQSFEASFSGYDVEIGTKIPQIEDLSAFLTYYKFQNDQVNVDLDGYRARAEYYVYKSNNHKHNLILEAEYSNDDLRDDITFYGLRYHYKFGKPKGLNKLEQRMTNRVVRDIDIVVPQIIPTTKKILANEDGTTTNIKFVDFDAAGGGDGSESSPFNTLDNTDNKFAANDIIYVLPQDDANARDTVNIQLLDGQKLVSAKEGIMVSDITGNAAHNFTIKKNSTANLPKVKQIQTGNNNLIQGFDVSNDDDALVGNKIIGTGIVINEKTGNIIKNNTSSTNTKSGIYVKTISNQSNQIASNTASNNADDGITVDTEGSSSNTISSNNIDGSGDDGIHISSFFSSSNTISSNNIDGSGDEGILIASSDNSGNTISNNDFGGSGDIGIFIYSTNSSSNTISSNNIDVSVNDGIRIQSFNSSGNTVSGNNIDDSGHSGIDINSSDSSGNTISSNNIDGSDDEGILIASSDNSGNTISNNDIDDSIAYGIKINSFLSSSNTISSNNIDGSGHSGIDINSNDSSGNTASGNNIDGSGVSGIQINSKNSSINSVIKNTISNNPTGIKFEASDTSRNAITVNTITDSTNIGLSGTISNDEKLLDISGNTYSGNAKEPVITSTGE